MANGNNNLVSVKVTQLFSCYRLSLFSKGHKILNQCGLLQNCTIFMMLCLFNVGKFTYGLNLASHKENTFLKRDTHWRHKLHLLNPSTWEKVYLMEKYFKTFSTVFKKWINKMIRDQLNLIFKLLWRVIYEELLIFYIILHLYIGSVWVIRMCLDPVSTYCQRTSCLWW